MTAAMRDLHEVREEHFENEPTGVEVEREGDEVGLEHKPWNPDEIRVSTKQFSLRNILDLIDENDLELAPDFQRNKVWKTTQKSLLIESILLQIPLPAFYFAEDGNGMMRVVDGLQRLSTVHDFVRGGRRSFELSRLEYLTIAEGKRYGELPPAMQRRINNAQIVVHVIDPTTPSSVKYDIFKRINTGGTRLNSQEIRHCMSNARSRDFLKRCTHSTAFDRATRGRFKNHVRMEDRELALRFCAFWLRGVEGYADHGAMDDFLDKANETLDDPTAVTDEDLENLYSDFCSAMDRCYEVFGGHAFRKWPLGSGALNPVNRPLFESWSYALGKYSGADVARRRNEIVSAAREYMTSDVKYIEAISTSTGDVRKVRLRFQYADLAAQSGR